MIKHRGWIAKQQAAELCFSSAHVEVRSCQAAVRTELGGLRFAIAIVGLLTVAQRLYTDSRATVQVTDCTGILVTMGHSLSSEASEP